MNDSCLPDIPLFIFHCLVFENPSWEAGSVPIFFGGEGPGHRVARDFLYANHQLFPFLLACLLACALHVTVCPSPTNLKTLTLPVVTAVHNTCRLFLPDAAGCLGTAGSAVAMEQLGVLLPWALEHLWRLHSSCALPWNHDWQTTQKQAGEGLEYECQEMCGSQHLTLWYVNTSSNWPILSFLSKRNPDFNQTSKMMTAC